MSLHLLDHPLAAHCLAMLRDRRTEPDAFRLHCERLTVLLAMEATRELPSVSDVVETPLERTPVRILASPLVAVPVLRAGLGMLAPVLHLLDPMLATGGSANEAVTALAAAGASDIRLLCVVAAPEGLAMLAERQPGLSIYAAARDRGLNERKFILPGLGDFGDRLYGTGG